MTFDAIIPAGGRASRLGGIVKPLLTIDGSSLLARALAAAGGARRTVVVGPPELPVPDGIALVREDPPFGGPVAAVAAGLRGLDADPADWLLLLAADLPRPVDLVAALLAAASRTDPAEDALVGVDPVGRRQWLAGLYRPAAVTAALRRAAAGPADPLSGLSLHRTLGGLRIRDVRLPAAITGDIDLPADAAAWNAETPGAATDAAPGVG